MLIINSAAYVTGEFQIEFGKIPPCMLPLGNRKLVEHQVLVARQAFPESRIFVTLPARYELSDLETKLLARLSVNNVFVPEGISLGESVLYAINTVGSHSAVVRLLHGDTVIEDLPNETDVVSVARTNIDYPWEIEKVTSAYEMVWSGFFAFGSASQFVRSLALSRGDFVSAVRDYGDHFRLSFRESNRWFDLGHVNTYFQSRSRITTQRHFNDLTIDGGIVKKRSNDVAKIGAEADWFSQLPRRLRRYCPHLLDDGIDDTGLRYYCLEYLPCVPLNEIFVHGRNPIFFWEMMASLLGDFLMEAQATAPSALDVSRIEEDSQRLFREKTHLRLESFSALTRFDLDRENRLNGVALPSIGEIAELCADQVCNDVSLPALIHGDLCFSNILFDSRAKSIKLLDPRGINASGEFTLFGDQRYDLAKLLHSSLGYYDFLIAGAYTLDAIGDHDFKFNIHIDARTAISSRAFSDVLFRKVGHQVPLHMVVLLFLAMLPLHQDRPDRQKAMLANALRIYAALDT